jgi:hypothetical protein
MGRHIVYCLPGSVQCGKPHYDYITTNKHAYFYILRTLHRDTHT